jgi:hypothetical protein
MELCFTCLGHTQHRTPATQSGDLFFTCSLFRTFDTEVCRTKPRSSAPLLQKGSTHDCSSSCDAASPSASTPHPCDVSRARCPARSERWPGPLLGPFVRSSVQVVLHEGARRLPHILSDKHICQELVGDIPGTVAGHSCVRYYERTQSHVPPSAAHVVGLNTVPH